MTLLIKECLLSPPSSSSSSSPSRPPELLEKQNLKFKVPYGKEKENFHVGGIFSWLKSQRGMRPLWRWFLFQLSLCRDAPSPKTIFLRGGGRLYTGYSSFPMHCTHFQERCGENGNSLVSWLCRVSIRKNLLSSANYHTYHHELMSIHFLFMSQTLRWKSAL